MLKSGGHLLIREKFKSYFISKGAYILRYSFPKRSMRVFFSERLLIKKKSDCNIIIYKHSFLKFQFQKPEFIISFDQC